jgi:hypothetical protein
MCYTKKMLNPFPGFLDFALFAPVIIRVFLGIYFIISGLRIFNALRQGNNVAEEVSSFSFGFALLFLLGGFSVFLGFYTQMGALMLIFSSILCSIKDKHNRTLYYILFAMALSLLFSGAGFLAFDLPL